MKEPPGYEPPFIVCPECGTYYGDMGSNVACEECGERLPTGRKHWVGRDGKPYPEAWADYEESLE